MLNARDGNFYGVASEGGSGNLGILFSFAPATRTFTVEREFLGPNGAYPEAPLVQAPSGLLYGATTFGGRHDLGTLFRFNPTTRGLAVLHRFDGSDGQYPAGRLVWHGGRLYGVARAGGLHLRGTLFSIAPNGTDFTVHHHFDIDTGTFPYGGLIEADDGNLYGTTATGAQGGSIFDFDPATGTLRPRARTRGLLHGALVRGPDGLLFGASNGSGIWGRGFIFAFDPVTGDLAQRFSFVPWYQLGWGPQGGLTQASDGLLYGLTTVGGARDDGVLYRFSTASDTYWPVVHLGGDKGRSPAFASLIEAQADVPATRVRPSPCGLELPLWRHLVLDPVDGARDYQVEIHADSDLQDPPMTLTSRGPRIRLSTIAGLNWGVPISFGPRPTRTECTATLGPCASCASWMSRRQSRLPGSDRPSRFGPCPPTRC